MGCRLTHACAVQLQQILKMTPTKRQTLLFSATMSAGVQQLIQLSLSRPVRLAADAAATTPATLRQEVVRLKGGAAVADKVSVLCALCSRALKGLRTIIFCREKKHAHWLKILLGLADIAPASELHGDMTQVCFVTHGWCPCLTARVLHTHLACSYANKLETTTQDAVVE